MSVRLVTRALAVVGVLVAVMLPVLPAVAAPSSGFDDWTCRPSAAHPRPVVLLHGLSSTGKQHWALHGPAVARAGYCVFAPTYGANVLGQGGQAPVDDSAREIGAYVDRVLATTGAEQVDLVGHSLGGFLSLYVTKVTGYASKVGRVVAFAPPTHGTTVVGVVNLLTGLGMRDALDAVLTGACVACVDLIEGGPDVTRLVDGPIAQPGVTYTVYASRFDAVVTPTSRSFVREAGVTNAYIQDRCALDPVGHFGIGFDTGVASMILNGLDPAVPIRCGFGPPV